MKKITVFLVLLVIFSMTLVVGCTGQRSAGSSAPAVGTTAVPGAESHTNQTAATNQTPGAKTNKTIKVKTNKTATVKTNQTMVIKTNITSVNLTNST
jgi:hypothetical protein